ncbi:MAG: NAD(P)H-dependent oxidoreductase subunit E [Terricaulis sp.]
MHKAWDSAAAERVLSAFASTQDQLLPMLHALQAEFGWIADEATPLLAATLNLSRAEVHGTISFYHDFRREPAGKVVVKLCRAEACQAMGGERTAAALLQRLGIGWSETTKDGAITVEAVYCLGLCAAAPAALIGETPAARLDGQSLIAQVEALR